MKIKCENVVVCGNYKCELNFDGGCIHTVVALDGDGKCVMYKPKSEANPISNDDDKPTQNKTDITHGALDY